MKRFKLAMDVAALIGAVSLMVIFIGCMLSAVV